MKIDNSRHDSRFVKKRQISDFSHLLIGHLKNEVVKSWLSNTVVVDLTTHSTF